ncbi:sodium:calcium antiporter [Pseudomonas sp. ABC1]|uniref:sodium:calcium antiporter n=1 Tax=Pseudomonas sp. ABC1 TaxID=2748080 RepID=UPI0015C3DFE9|nr:sodium:calcium antiporter [Pseudomonas sp. ABC1]QLF94367.1 sodium:calcium antiporter [Pseudomonas sp. ABC1]
MDLIVLLHLALGLTLLMVGNEMSMAALARLSSAMGQAWLANSGALATIGNALPAAIVSILAAVQGHGDLALGNVLGGHIAGLLPVLGCSALLAPLLLPARLLRVELPILLGALLLAFLLAQDSTLDRLDASLLLLGALAYALWHWRAMKASAVVNEDSSTNTRRRRRTWVLAPLQLLLGIALLYSGAVRLLDGTRDMALALGLSDLLAGLTLLALLTSIPLLFSVVGRLLHGERERAASHIVAACIINLLLVLGLAALLSPHSLSVSPNALDIDFPVMLMATLACLMIACAGRMPRWQGVLLLGHYAAYVLYLALFATGRPQLERLDHILFAYALPLTILALSIPIWLQRKTRS